jgi:hypothetical protein
MSGPAGDERGTAEILREHVAETLAGYPCRRIRHDGDFVYVDGAFTVDGTWMELVRMHVSWFELVRLGELVDRGRD